MIDSIPQKSPGGDKSDKIEPQEAVLVSFEGRIAVDRTVRNGLHFQKVDSWLVVVGDSDVVPALEMVRKTKGDYVSLVEVGFSMVSPTILSSKKCGNIHLIDAISLL